MAAQFLKGLFQTGSGKLSVIVLGFLTLMIITRVLPPDLAGTFMLMHVLAIFLMELSSFGLHMAIPKFMAGAADDTSRQQYVSTAVIFRMGTIIAATGLAVLVADPLAMIFGFTIPAELLIFLPIMVFLESVVKLLTAIMQGNFQFREIGITHAINSFINAAGTVLFLIVLDQGILGLFYARALARLVAIVYGLFVTPLYLESGFHKNLLRQMLSFGFPLQINYILSFIYQRIDTFLIGILLGPTQVAYYEIARRIPDSLIDGYEAFIQVYYPYIADFYTGGKKKALDTLLNTSNRWMMFGAIFGTLIACIFGEQIVVAIFSEQYRSSAPLLALLMLAMTFIILDSNLGYVLVGIGDSDKPVYINTLRTIISIGCYLLILPVMGMVGAALVNTISLVLVLPLVIHFLRRRDILVQTGTFLRPLILLCVLLIIWRGLSLDMVWQQIILIAAFIPASILTGIIPMEDISYLLEKVRPHIYRTLLKIS